MASVRTDGFMELKEVNKWKSLKIWIHSCKSIQAVSISQGIMKKYNYRSDQTSSFQELNFTWLDSITKQNRLYIYWYAVSFIVFLLIVYMGQPLLIYDILNPLKIMHINYPFSMSYIRLPFFRQYFLFVSLLLPLLLINHSVCSIFLSFLFSALNFVESMDGTRIENKERMRKWVWSKSDSATRFIDSTARTILLLLLFEFGLINLIIFFILFSP